MDAEVQAVIAWARGLLARADWVVLDTETTGLNGDAEIVELAILAPDGAIRFNARFRPAGPIPPEASRVHGIRDADVAGCATFAARWIDLCNVLAGTRLILSYNAAFDARLLTQTMQRYDCARAAPPWAWDCVMERFAVWYGEWNAYHGNYTYKRLGWAATCAGVPAPGHSALADARATLGVVRWLAAQGDAPAPAGLPVEVAP